MPVGLWGSDQHAWEVGLLHFKIEDFGGLKGFAEEVTLAGFAGQRLQHKDLLERLNALGDNVNIKIAGQLNYGMRQGREVATRVNAGHERAVNLQNVEGELVQTGQRRV